MPSRSNPNTPSRQRPKTARTISKRRNHIAKTTKLMRRAKSLSSGPSSTDPSTSSSSLQEAISNGDVKIQSVLRSSQALRQARPLSGKKTKKLERKARFDKRRREEAEAKEEEARLAGMGEVKMKDVGGGGGGGVGAEPRAVGGEGMEVDGV